VAAGLTEELAGVLTLAAELLAAVPLFALPGAAALALADEVFAFASPVVGEPAGRAPLNSLGLATSLAARKFSIFASFIAIV
jgi:hypothetical protein